MAEQETASLTDELSRSIAVMGELHDQTEGTELAGLAFAIRELCISMYDHITTGDTAEEDEEN